jgi:hypothetical protein
VPWKCFGIAYYCSLPSQKILELLGANKSIALDQIKRLQEGHDAFKEIWQSTGHDGGVLKGFPAAE